MPESQSENLYEISQEKKVFRETLKDEKTPESIKKTAKENLAETKSSLSGLIKKEGGLSAVKEILKKDKTESEKTQKSGLDEKAIAESFGEKAPIYEKLSVVSRDLESLKDFEMRRSLEAKSDSHALRAHESLLQTARKEIKGKEANFFILQSENPNEARALELVENAEGLGKEGHIAPTKSVRENLLKIGRNMMLGKPMFLHGPTGTGKTSIARFAAERFTGKSAEMVYCNPQTRESTVWGKTGIRPTKEGAIETIDIFGPLAKAMSEGKVVIFDEFTALPKEQMVFIKGIFNAKIGDTVNIVNNGRVKIAPGFQMIFTANLKSEKNPERQDLPVEIAREFEQNNLKIDYLPKDESYDVMLARLMEKDGSVRASWLTLNETLPKLSEAIEEIEIAYTGSLSQEIARITGSMDASGKTAGLKKFVMTQGTVEAITLDWKMEKARGGKTSFAKHVDNRLKIALTFEEYPLSDRILAARILASKGFLRTLTPKELNLPNDVFHFDAANRLRGDEEAMAKLEEESGKEKNIPLKELAELDPFHTRKTSAVEEARKLVEETKRKRKESGGETTAEKITVEYKYNDEIGNEQTETIELDIEKSLESFAAFYEKHNIDLPADFEEKIKDIWERNHDQIRAEAERLGFDELLIIPGNLNLPELHKKMTEDYNETWQGENFKAGSSFQGVQETTDETRIVLVHKNRAQNLKDRQELKATLDKTIQSFIDKGENIALTDYLIYQRKYFEENQKHLDEINWICLPGSKSGARFGSARWSPAAGELLVFARVAEYRSVLLGCRLSRCFT